MKQIVLLSFLVFFILTSASAQRKHITVSADGSGDYKTVQEAIDAVPDYSSAVTRIFIRNGIYKEKLNLPVEKEQVRFVGESVERTILTFDDFASKKNSSGKNIGTRGSASFFIYGKGFSAENITFANSSGPVGQAVALWVSADKAIFVNCRMLGFQDTLYTAGIGSRQYFRKCYIEGTVDFIFGSATAVFEDCEIYCKKGGGYITAASTADSAAYGYVFRDCRITGNAGDHTFYLGRPWRPDAKVVYINCDLGNIIRPEGWHNWGKEANEKTSYYAEYKNRGKGSIPEKRVKWSHQLSKKDVKAYQLDKVFRNWVPTIN